MTQQKRDLGMTIQKGQQKSSYKKEEDKRMSCWQICVVFTHMEEDMLMNLVNISKANFRICCRSMTPPPKYKKKEIS